MNDRFKQFAGRIFHVKARSVFVLAIVLRMSLLLLSMPWENDWPKKVISADSFEYTVLGRSLVTRGEFSYTWPGALPNALRLPAYPLFVGLTSFGGNLSFIWCTVVIQIVVDSLFAAFLVKSLGALFSDDQLGCVAGVLYAVNPDAVFWSTQVMPESMSAWMIIGSLSGLSAAYKLLQPRLLWQFAAGTCCAGVLPLTKPAWQ